MVRLIDVFEVDSDSFCTVLELCTGDDLDARLKAQGSISEREARAILAQVFNGLAHMSSGPKRIIHYDLKPGNILFDDAGRVKITDFGLSKIMEERSIGFGADSGMELTPQGAGHALVLTAGVFRDWSGAAKNLEQGGHVVVRRYFVPDDLR